MKIDAKSFLLTMRDFDFLSFPRTVGNPFQKPVFNPHGFWQFVKMNNASQICFTSHNSYPDWDGKTDPMSTRVGKLFFDFDHNKIENALRDVRRLSSFLESEDIPWVSAFSGQKGFHAYSFLKRRNMEITNHLWDKIIAMHTFFRYKGDKGRAPTYYKSGKIKTKGRPWLPTLDAKVAEPKRLCRIPFTRHVSIKNSSEYEVHVTHCIPLTKTQLLDSDIDDIVDMSKTPIIGTQYKEPGTLHTLDELIDHLDVNVAYWLSVGRDSCGGGGKFVPAEYDGIPNDDFAVYISKLIPRPCIHGDLFTDSPGHFTRFITVVQLKKLRMSYEEIVEIFDTMAEKFNWVDKGDRRTMLYQISHIYNKKTNVGGYWHASCGTIKRKYRMCVGPKCPRWFDSEGENAENKKGKRRK